jgi:hypothetical protein
MSYVLFFVFFVLSSALVLVLFASVIALLLWGIKPNPEGAGTAAFENRLAAIARPERNLARPFFDANQ